MKTEIINPATGTLLQGRIRNQVLCLVAMAVLLQSPAISRAVPVIAIAGGSKDTLFIESDGSFYTVGDNLNGEIGDDTTTTIYAPEQILPSGVTAVAGGYLYSMFVKSDGSLWGMGYNGYGQIGNGKTSNPHKPVETVSSGVVAVATKNVTTLFLKSDGSLWGMGYNGYGQLGDGTFNSTNLPEQIVAGGVTAVACGYDHSLFLKSDGSLWGMGYNADGELGDGTVNSTNLPEQIVAGGVTAIACGAFHSLFLKSDGSLWAMGYNTYGQLGDGTTISTNLPEQIVASNVVAIAAGQYHSLFLKSDGSLWAVGYSLVGQLGDGAPFVFTNQPEEVVTGGVTAVAAGDEHSLFLQLDGSLWTMGLNDYGQLADGNNSGSFRSVPQAVLFPETAVTPTAGVTPLTVQFTSSGTDEADNAITNWNWGFGDSTTGTNQNSTHTYTADGAYRPSLLVNNGGYSRVTLPWIVSASYSGLVLNGGFEVGPSPFPSSSETFYGWSKSGNLANSSVVGTPHHSGRYAAQSDPTGSPGFLLQTLATTAGTRYLLSFWILTSVGAPTNDFNVSWNGTRIFDRTNAFVPAVFTNLQFLVTATGAGTPLQFGFQSDHGTYYLDDVSVTPAVLNSGITNFSLGPSSTNLTLTGTNGIAGEYIYTLMTTNLTLPVNQWTPVATNVLAAGGKFAFTATNAVDPAAPQRFYLFQFY